MDILQFLKTKIDIENSNFITPNATLKLHFYQNSNKSPLFQTRIDKMNQLITIPVNVKNGEVIIPETKIGKCKIAECLSLADNYFAEVEIFSKTKNPINLKFFKPINVQKLNRNNFEVHHISSCEDEDIKQKLDFSKIRINHLNSEESDKIKKLCVEYSDVFYKENSTLTFTNQIKHRIKTRDEIPIYTKSYRYPYIHKEEVEKQIQSMLEQKIIRPSDSPWSSPIWIVPKKLDKSGKQKWRLVVDYRKVNERTIDDKYPIPNITEILDKLGKCNYFTTIDLASGFHQIEMHKDDIIKTAFNVENGHYEYLRMPFGLKNAPATFQRVMNNILRGYVNKICLLR